MKPKQIVISVGALCGLLALYVPVRVVMTGWEPPMQVNFAAFTLGVVAIALLGPVADAYKD